jgi:hypothetical protein
MCVDAPYLTMFVGDVFSKKDWVEGRRHFLRGGAARRRVEWVRQGPVARAEWLRDLVQELSDNGFARATLRGELSKIDGFARLMRWGDA